MNFEYAEPSGDMIDMMNEDEYRTPMGKPRSWDSLIGERKAGMLTARPITTSGQLLHLGREMHNCIPYYDEQCDRGDVRIFSLHLPDGTLAGAAEIVRKVDRGWTPGETQEMEERSSREQLTEAVTTLANMYQHAENRTGWRRMPKG